MVMFVGQKDVFIFLFVNWEEGIIQGEKVDWACSDFVEKMI